MRFFSKLFGMILFVLLCHHIKGQKTINTQNMFELAEEPKNNTPYELIQYAKIRNESASMGDFLSRLWGHFGKPKDILFEGFIYSLKEKKSGLQFLASYGASGPAFFGKKDGLQKLKPVIERFETFLDNANNADCEIEVDTDFGIYLCGAKDGIAYNKQTFVYNTEPSADERLIKSITDLRTSLENKLKDSNHSYKQKDIDDCISILANYSMHMLDTHSKEEGTPILKSAVKKLNSLNKKYNYSLIETTERELISEIMLVVGIKKGYNDLDKDITKEWRKW